MAMTSSSQAGTHSTINVTPLIDVLLVLLIIFMVIQPAVVHGLQALAPHSSQDAIADPDPRTVVVQVKRTAGGQAAYSINQQPVALADLGQALTSIFAGRREPVLFIRGEAGLEYATVLAAIDSGHAAGATSIGIVTRGME